MKNEAIEVSVHEDVGLHYVNPTYAAGGMSSEWLTKPLGEIVSFKTGKLDSNASENDGKYPFFTCSPITLRINDFAFDTEAVILAGNNANGVFSTKHYSGKFNAYQRTYVIEPLNLKEVSCRYIYFVISHMVSHLQELAIGTSTKFLTKTILNRLKIHLPPKIEQDQIAALLSSLDDRITLLRETNATLEAIAQALFKSWFVDFDPVRVKQQGREPEGTDAETAALFPDSFEESELGLIPMGWRVDSIYVAAQVIYGAPFASSKFNSEGIGKPLIRIRDLKKEAPGVFTPEVHPKGYLVQPGDIIVGMDGEFRAYLWGGEEAWLNQRVCVFVPISGFPASFVHRSIMPILAVVEASETATTVIHLGKNDIDRFRIVIPNEAVLKAFGEITDSIYKRIVEQKQTSRTLATLRDTLLPRLISGQLRLPDAEVVGRVTTAWIQEVEQRMEQLPSPQGLTRQIDANMSGYAALTRPTQDSA